MFVKKTQVGGQHVCMQNIFMLFFGSYVTLVTHSFIFVSAVRVAGSVFPRMVRLQMLEVTPQVTCHPFEIKAQCGDHFHGNHSSMTILQESVRTPSSDASGKNKIKSSMVQF